MVRKGILTAFGENGQKGFCTGQVWFQSEGRVFRLPKSAAGLVGQKVYADVHEYRTPSEDALINSRDLPILVHGFVKDYQVLHKACGFKSGVVQPLSQ